MARPDIVSDVQIQSGKSELRSGSEHISGLFELARREDHAQVAKYASLPLLHAFPTRCKLKHIESPRLSALGRTEICRQGTASGS